MELRTVKVSYRIGMEEVSLETLISEIAKRGCLEFSFTEDSSMAINITDCHNRRKGIPLFFVAGSGFTDDVIPER